jgi:hypothetical protein
MRTEEGRKEGWRMMRIRKGRRYERETILGHSPLISQFD